MTRLRLPAVALALLISCNAWADLKTFDVDPQYSQEIFNALQKALAPTGNPLVPTQGHVQLLPSGQILVNASPEALEQVERVLQAIRARPVAAAPRAELRYWAVLGGSGANPPGTPPPSALDDVLSELRRLHGDFQFRVIGSALLATESGQQGEVRGTPLNVNQTVYVQGDALNAAIDMDLIRRTWDSDGVPASEFSIGNLSVRTALRRGEFVVLGQSMLGGGGLDGPVFFIVHWPEAQGR